MNVLITVAVLYVPTNFFTQFDDSNNHCSFNI